MKRIFQLALIPLTVLFVSCSSTTSTGRIEKNPQIYNDLSLREQELVSQGQIAEGMSPGAVFLAWGDPDRRLEGQSGRVRTMRWDYTSMQPVYTNNIYGYYGFGHHGRYSRGLGFGPTVEYIPAHSATVWFENDRVKSWERAR